MSAHPNLSRPDHGQPPGRTAWPRAIALAHWLTVVLLLAAVALVAVRSGVDGRAPRAFLLDLHRGAGLLIALLALVRLVLRWRYRRGVPPPPVQGVWKLLATGSHALLYAGLLLVPMLGWALASARGLQISLVFGSLPALVATDPDLADSLGDAHRIAAVSLLGLATAHALAALWHHLVRRDGVLRAMLPRRRSSP